MVTIKAPISRILRFFAVEHLVLGTRPLRGSLWERENRAHRIHLVKLAGSVGV